MLNKIMLIGNLGQDPEMSYTPSGKAITKFSLAVNRNTRDRETNEQRKETTWFRIVAWEQKAEFCNQYLHKGSRVFIEGRMTSRKYTNKDGIEVTAWEVLVENTELLDSRSDGSGAGGGRGDSGDVGPDDIPF
ncbi:MAG: Single-stranded DNA-binding protein [Ktedonobacterales bacterium]|jgi:single-strand DNA-binding protein|nr:MAG: Single-stranded DNA-binding protein [Ktedonobacterales bacterium]